eukprot:CAMPEP_0168338070 /NCGR_PEP_ID=MMETSP0213-20121227/12598_1 /TAXON_ID=151035 /ORGANISM="Euplotes harpa, Strain FSP1.4" /LENGTH=318 /DNA_ID=CAMNT_0008343743 /DNA_START=26 /DNA_END=978 /DNA_ORIENTATION=-
MLHILAGVGQLYQLVFGGQDVSPLVELEDYPETQITDLIIYPCSRIKGVHVEETKVLKHGLEFDRDWLLLKKDISKQENKTSGGRLITLRNSESLGITACRFETKGDNTFVVFSHPDQPKDLWVNVQKPQTDEVVTFYDYDLNEIEALSEGAEAHKWFSEIVGIDVLFVKSTQKFKPTTHQQEFNYILKEDDLRKGGHGKAAVHLINRKSVEHLNSKIKDSDSHATPYQFRPNLIIEGVEADDEDDMREMVLVSDGTTFRQTQHCVRCREPTYNTDKGKFSEDGEPMKTLSTYKIHPEIGTVFGVLLQADSECTLRVG